MAAERPRLSVVIPVYGSEKYLERTVTGLTAVLDSAGQGSFEVILVNDGSPDAVQSVIEALAARDPRIRWLELGKNGGQHPAVLRGLGMSSGDVVVTIDDDGQNPPEAVLAVAEALRAGRADVIYGRFPTVAQSSFRRLASALNRRIIRSMGAPRHLSVTNVRAIRGDLARHLAANSPVHPYLEAMVFAATNKVHNVDVPHLRRVDGRSTYTFGRLFALWFAHVSTLSVLPLRVAMVGSFVASGVGLGAGLIQMAIVLSERQAPPGWLSLFVATTFLFGVLFAFLGVLAAYVGRLYVGTNSKGLAWVRSVGGENASPGNGPQSMAS